MVDVPADTPVTRPVPAIVAAVVLLLLHVPPMVASVSGVVEPTHTVAVPVIAGGPEVTFTVTVDIQLPPNEYVMMEVPMATPFTMPVVRPTVALVVLLLVQVPPPTPSLREVVAPTQMLVIPVIGPGAGVTVTSVVV